MKKLANLTALFIFVSVNVLTPVSYAQFDEEILQDFQRQEVVKEETIQNKELGSVLVSGPTSEDKEQESSYKPESTVEDFLSMSEKSEDGTSEIPVGIDQTEEVITEEISMEEDYPSEGISKEFDSEDKLPEDGLSEEVSAINLVKKSVNQQLLLQNHVRNVQEAYGGITYNFASGYIELSDGDERIRIRDKNVGAADILSSNDFKLLDLVNLMCEFDNVASDWVHCEEGFTNQALALIVDENVETFEEIIEYYLDVEEKIEENLNNPLSYGNYYYWGNDEAGSISCYIEDSALSVSCDIITPSDFISKNSNYNNTGWYKGHSGNPCDTDKGEYLPSPDDWERLGRIYENIMYPYGQIGSVNDVYEHRNMSDSHNFLRTLFIPFSSCVEKYDVRLSSLELNYPDEYSCLMTAKNGNGDFGNMVWEWSDGPRIRYQDAYNNHNDLEDWEWHSEYDMISPVRCFVYVNPITVEFYMDESLSNKIDSITVDEGEILNFQAPEKAGHILDGWYIKTDGESELFDVNTPVSYEDSNEGLIKLYADRTKCENGQIVKNNQCVYEVEHDKIKGILKVTDGERKIYIKDRNVGATISAGLDNVNRLYMLMDEECILDGYSDIETDRGDYYDCSPKFYEEAAKILGLPSVTDLIIEDYLDEYYYLDDENYVASFGNYYFWGNNTGSSYTGLDISRDNGTLRNASELLSIGFNGGVLENSGWVEGYYDNPCDNSKGEYLPTSDDWATVMNIRESNNPEFMDDYDDGGLRDVGEYEPEYAFYGKAAAQFQQDLLIPTAGYIYKGCETAMEFGDTETDECGGLSYHYKQHDTPVTTLRAGKNKHGYFGSLFGNPYSIDMYSTMDLDDNMASPVRCFVFVEPKDVKFVDGSNSWTVKVESGDSVNEPEHSQSEGRTFNGWYNGSQKWDFESPVTGNITLTAKYDMITNRVTFISNGGSQVNPMDIEHGQPITNMPRPTKEGYNFDGWYMDEGLTQKYTNQPITQAITLYAKWSEKSSSPSNGYSGGGGSSSRPSSKGSGPSTTDVKSVDNEPSTPTKEVKINPKPVVPGKGANSTGKVSSNQELFDAYKWAYDNGLTKYANMSDARMDDLLNRQEMAKISTIFATKFQGETPNEKKRNDCSQYPDLWKTTKDMQEFIIQSCELGYMGYRANGVDYLERFRPYTPVSVAEVSIILSRIMWQNRYAIDENYWYQGHLHAVYENNLLDNISKPFDYIARKDAYIMLYRISKTL